MFSLVHRNCELDLNLTSGNSAAFLPAGKVHSAGFWGFGGTQRGPESFKRCPSALIRPSLLVRLFENGAIGCHWRGLWPASVFLRGPSGIGTGGPKLPPVAPYAVNPFLGGRKQVSMRFGVSIMLLVAKQKERSDSNPKGIGNVASRLCVPEFVVVACGPQLVGGRHRLVVDSVAGGLYVDATLAGYHGFAVGLVRRRDFGRSILGRSSDRAAPVHAGDGVGPHLPGLHQAFASMDGGIGRVAARSASGNGCGRNWPALGRSAGL